MNLPRTANLGARTSGGVSYKDFDTGDGYVYRQYQDKAGDILILKSPRGGKGTLVTSDTHPDAWKAITAQIRAIREGKTASTLTTVFNTLTTVATSLTPRQRRRRKQKLPPEIVSPTVPDPSPPWGLIAGVGVAATALLLVLRKPART